MQTGSIWLMALAPQVGSTSPPTQACVIVSPTELNDHLPTVMVAPVATSACPAAFRVAMTLADKPGLILLDHLRSIDKTRLGQHLGHLHPSTLDKTLRTLQAVFAPSIG